jgi:hypothetical protein
MKIRNACLVLAALPWALPAFAGERSERLLPPDPAATPGTSNVAEAAAQTDGSFPVEMARDYILGAGYSAVSDLKPVNNFVWRGTAVKDGVTFNVAVDYTGTVVGAN